MLNSKEADFILRGDGEVIYPEISKDGLEMYYDVKGKKNSDKHKDKLLDMSGQGKDGELSGFDYDGELSGYDGDNGLVFDGIEDTLKMPKLSGIDADNFTYQLNNNILAFTGVEVKTVRNGDVEVGGRNLLPHFTSNRWDITATIIDNYYIESSPNDTFSAKIALELEPHTEYTFTFNTENGRYYIYDYPEGTEGDTIHQSGSSNTASVVNTFTTGEETSILLWINNWSQVLGATRKAWDMKLEKGKIATDWTPAPEDLIEKTELRGNILGDMEDIVDASPRDRQSGKEVFTEHADDSHVHVEVDGQSYQHAGSGKNLFVPVRLKTNHSIKENCKLINTIGSQIFYPIESPIGVYTASFSYQHNLNYAPIFMTFYYSDGSSDGDSHGYLDSTSQKRKEMTSSSAKKVVGVGYNAPTVIGVEWDTSPDPNMTRYGLALDAGVKTIGVSWDMESNPSMIRSGGLI